MPIKKKKKGDENAQQQQQAGYNCACMIIEKKGKDQNLDRRISGCLKIHRALMVHIISDRREREKKSKYFNEMFEFERLKFL